MSWTVPRQADHAEKGHPSADTTSQRLLLLPQTQEHFAVAFIMTYSFVPKTSGKYCQSAEQDCKQRHADFPVHTPIVIDSRCGRVGWMLISRGSEVSYGINELRFP